jgi:streptogramin lyase
VDSAGDLWIANQNTNAVVEYTPDALAATGAPTPAATVTMADSSGTVALAFDAKGNLWVVNQYAGTINELTPSQLVTGTPTPVVTIQDGLHGSVSNQIGNNPIAMTFDAAGNLWLAQPGASNIVEYTASQLTTSGSQSPAVTLSEGSPFSASDTAFVTPYALAFDHEGNLWVAMAAGSFFEFAPSALTTSGVPTARMKLTPPQSPGHDPYPVAVAFDHSGNLWFGMLAGLSVGEYTAAQIAAGGNPAPAILFNLSGSLSPTAIAFDPHSPGLPLH